MAVEQVESGWRHFTPFHWREAALCAPAMPLLILTGTLIGRPVDGATVAGAAFAVGFGAARELGGRRWGAMIAAMLGMSLAAFAGCLLGQNVTVFVIAAAMAAALCAAAALRNEDVWWVILQLVITFLVAGNYAGSAGAGAHRALVVLAGGAAQIAIVRVLATIFPAAAGPTSLPRVLPMPEPGVLGAHMVRAAICIAASLLIAQRIGLSNSYWAAMTALIVLKPRLHETGMRGLARLTGTLAGCGVATAYAHVCRDSALLLGLGMALSAMAAFALQKAHYASLTAAITATVVLLLTLGHSSALSNAEHRLAATLLGGVIALAVAGIVPHAHRLRRSSRQVQADRVGTASS